MIAEPFPPGLGLVFLYICELMDVRRAWFVISTDAVHVSVIDLLSVGGGGHLRCLHVRECECFWKLGGKCKMEDEACENTLDCGCTLCLFQESARRRCEPSAVSTKSSCFEHNCRLVPT